MFMQNSDKHKTMGDKDSIELLSEGADQNPCAWLNNLEDTSPDEMKVFVAHLIVMGILKKILWNSIGVETAFSAHHFLVTTCPEIIFQNILWNLHISDPDETNP